MGIVDLVCGVTRGIFVHGEGLRESSTSCGAGRWGFVSMVKDYGNIRPRMGRGAGDSCPRSRITGILDFVLGGTLGIPFHGEGLGESSTSFGAGRWGLVSMVKA
jgi:hypothetical protein